jgi:hypothetical protein
MSEIGLRCGEALVGSEPKPFQSRRVVLQYTNAITVHDRNVILRECIALVSRSYGAQCTPDFFGFNAQDELQYRGRLDASRTTLVPNARRDLFEKQVAATGHGPANQTPSMGCSIKWKD